MLQGKSYHGETMPEEMLWHCLSCGRLLHASAIENPLLILHTHPDRGVFCPPARRLSSYRAMRCPTRYGACAAARGGCDVSEAMS